MEKTTVTFAHEDGREIKIPITIEEGGNMELTVDFGKGGESVHGAALHARLAMMFFNHLTSLSEPSSELPLTEGQKEIIADLVHALSANGKATVDQISAVKHVLMECDIEGAENIELTPESLRGALQGVISNAQLLRIMQESKHAI